MPPVPSKLVNGAIPHLNLKGINDWRNIKLASGGTLPNAVAKNGDITRWEPGQKLVFGHRGLRVRLPNGQLSVELSRGAIQQLLDAGIHRIEADLAVDKTGKVWLCHPKDLYEITRFKGLIAETDVSSLSETDRELVRREIKDGVYTDEYEPTGEYLLSLEEYILEFVECFPNLQTICDTRDCDPAAAIAEISWQRPDIRRRLVDQILNFCGDAHRLRKLVNASKRPPHPDWESMELAVILSHNPGALHHPDYENPEGLSSTTTDVQAMLEHNLRWQNSFFEIKNKEGGKVFKPIGFDTPVVGAWKYLVAEQLVYHPVLGASSEPKIVTMYARDLANKLTLEHNRKEFPSLFTIMPSAQPTFIDPATGAAYLSQFHHPALIKQEPNDNHQHHWFQEASLPGSAVRNGADGTISDSPLAEIEWLAREGML